MARAAGLTLEVCDDYALEEHITRVIAAPAGPQRCFECYKMRLSQAARTAVRLRLKYVTTTLLVSPYQHHELVRKAGEQAASELGLSFVYQDWRAGFRTGRIESKALGLYHQGYCGCVFSEAERLSPKSRPQREGGS
jgi:predicted adenine nucleotide alpha hydrolase (AANH) superfamily ATPase